MKAFRRLSVICRRDDDSSDESGSSSEVPLSDRWKIAHISKDCGYRFYSFAPFLAQDEDTKKKKKKKKEKKKADGPVSLRSFFADSSSDDD